MLPFYYNFFFSKNITHHHRKYAFGYRHIFFLYFFIPLSICCLFVLIFLNKRTKEIMIIERILYRILFYLAKQNKAIFNSVM